MKFEELVKNSPPMDREWYSEMKLDYSRVAFNDEYIRNGIHIQRSSPEIGAPLLYSKVRSGNKKLIHKTISQNNMGVLQIFLDQYRDAKRPLPNVDPSKMRWCRGRRVSDPKYFRQMMEIMLHPLDNYDDLIDALKQYEAASGQKVLCDDLFTGNIEDWTEISSTKNTRDEETRFEADGDGRYRFAYWERGRRDDLFIVYNIRHAYEYILQCYCDIIKP